MIHYNIKFLQKNQITCRSMILGIALLASPSPAPLKGQGKVLSLAGGSWPTCLGTTEVCRFFSSFCLLPSDLLSIKHRDKIIKFAVLLNFISFFVWNKFPVIASQKRNSLNTLTKTTIQCFIRCLPHNEAQHLTAAGLSAGSTASGKVLYSTFMSKPPTLGSLGLGLWFFNLLVSSLFLRERVTLISQLKPTEDYHFNLALIISFIFNWSASPHVQTFHNKLHLQKRFFSYLQS